VSTCPCTVINKISYDPSLLRVSVLKLKKQLRSEIGYSPGEKIK
jgi:hypothetical protein